MIEDLVDDDRLQAKAFSRMCRKASAQIVKRPTGNTADGIDAAFGL